MLKLEVLTKTCPTVNAYENLLGPEEDSRRKLRSISCGLVQEAESILAASSIGAKFLSEMNSLSVYHSPLEPFDRKQAREILRESRQKVEKLMVRIVPAEVASMKYLRVSTQDGGLYLQPIDGEVPSEKYRLAEERGDVIYFRSIRDKEEAPPGVDVLALVKEKACTSKEIGFCMEEMGSSQCSEVELPRKMKENIMQFIDKNRDSKEWVCYDFVNIANGKSFYPHRQLRPEEWEMKGFDRDQLAPGTTIMMKTHAGIEHVAIYLEKNQYLSKLGEDRLVVGTLEEMQDLYRTDEVYILIPKGREL